MKHAERRTRPLVNALSGVQMYILIGPHGSKEKIRGSQGFQKAPRYEIFV